ncbi:hypothetical protein MNBD_GAMMA10-3275 [hydrothermal vent metagenome]|uniref:Lipoprotein n=1 Tax=hydrothermal vent metagenome TaxID=652676 RepID=A0A3B0YE68_9ZZZZ
MKKHTPVPDPYFYLSILLLILSLGGCAGTPPENDEGGISGTGHGENCDDLKQKIKEGCRIRDF